MYVDISVLLGALHMLHDKTTDPSESHSITQTFLSF